MTSFKVNFLIFFYLWPQSRSNHMSQKKKNRKNHLTVIKSHHVYTFVSNNNVCVARKRPKKMRKYIFFLLFLLRLPIMARMARQTQQSRPCQYNYLVRKRKTGKNNHQK